MNVKNKNVIIKIEKNSIAEEVGIEPGDILVSVNKKPVEDVFDYRYLIYDEYIKLVIETPDGKKHTVEIEKDEGEDLGIVFETGLMDNAKSCRNKCIFCFIDQLPHGMRETLYFKDDDSRLSFLSGNYVTLTNMSDEDIDRIIFYRLSPINISVHTSDLELRKKMLNNKNAGNLIKIIEKLYSAEIEMNMQAVLCKGINDGKCLEKTIDDMSAFYPFAKSLSVVPVGITKHRDGLYPLLPFEKSDSEQVIRLIEKKQAELKERLGSAFVFAADEFYLNAERKLPPYKAYEDFYQIENGVGMLALFKKEFDSYLKASGGKSINRTVSVATGEAAYAFIKRLAARLCKKHSGLDIRVYSIKNEFFGGKITVSGLLTGQDIIKQLKGKELGETLFLPQNLLRSGERVLLDDVTVEDIERALSVKIEITENSGKSFALALAGTEGE